MSEAPIHHIVFLRHGESVGNAEQRFQGQADFPLTGRGREQARALAECWQTQGMTFDRCIASPLLRARQTAEIVCAALGLAIAFDPDWMEVHNGRLAGLTHEEGNLAAPRPAFMTPYTHFGQTGESRWELYLRAGRGLQKLIDSPPVRSLVVAHGGVLNMVMYAMLNIPVQADSAGPRFLFGNTGFATLEYQPRFHNWNLVGFDGGQMREDEVE
ncbi:MAG: histidine phosphatase family protein [Anaerolineales bacterium]|nr:histidine phosphatase family protein [Anaerolineales bacterium]